jgi:hypothetical protein
MEPVMNKFLQSLPEEVRGVLIDMVNEQMRPGGKYDPFTGDNVCEALISAKDPQFGQLATHLRSGDAVAVNAALHLICREYWFDYGCKVMTEDALEAVANGEHEYREPAIEPWERKLPALLERQAEW